MSREFSAWNKGTGFAQVGGLNKHIFKLRRYIVYPLLYPELYSTFDIEPPRGILFHGPPGTGKTLVAKALAEECNGGSRAAGQPQVHFLHCNSSEVYDKWVGSSERKLKSIFDKAIQHRPAIIFFDEIDAIAPQRSAKHDPVHTSVVATLLTQMNGLDSTPGVIVIGATNRLDALDPALRRTGRFDLELEFNLPDRDARKDILSIFVRGWPHKLEEKLLNDLADATDGFCGSDLQALCNEAVVCSAERKYPGINKNSISATNIDFKSIKVKEEDFECALDTINPSCRRFCSPKYRFLNENINNDSRMYLAQILEQIRKKWSHFFETSRRNCGKGAPGKILLAGAKECAINHQILPALIKYLEHLPVHVLDLTAMRELRYGLGEEALASEQILREARRSLPSILIAPKIDEWWNLLDENTLHTILTQLEHLDSNVPVLFIATSKKSIPNDLKEYFTLIIQTDTLQKNLTDEKINEILYGKRRKDSDNKRSREDEKNFFSRHTDVEGDSSSRKRKRIEEDCLTLRNKHVIKRTYNHVGTGKRATRYKKKTKIDTQKHRR